MLKSEQSSGTEEENINVDSFSMHFVFRTKMQYAKSGKELKELKAFVSLYLENHGQWVENRSLS